jgi:hypothetical protein
MRRKRRRRMRRGRRMRMVGLVFFIRPPTFDRWIVLFYFCRSVYFFDPFFRPSDFPSCIFCFLYLLILTDDIAENHYSADYPDEEVESDDEFGRNAYAYRTGNASDLEEWDLEGDSGDSEEEEMRFSDDEVERLKFPWLRRG